MLLPGLVHCSLFTVHRIITSDNHEPLARQSASDGGTTACPDEGRVNPDSPIGRRKTKGFTLIELLIAITIIAIIIGIGTLSWTKSQEKARDGKRKSDAKTIQQGLEEYFQTNHNYPLAASCSNDTSGNWDDGFKSVLTGTPTYLKDVPRDPANNAEFKYCYEPTTTNSKYNLYLRLENTADPEAESLFSNSYGTFNYKLTNP